jgi:hypothetical protein
LKGFLDNPLGNMKICLPKFSQGSREVEQIASGGGFQHVESSRRCQSAFFSFPPSPPVIHQQQRGVKFYRQGNRLSLAKP